MTRRRGDEGTRDERTRGRRDKRTRDKGGVRRRGRETMGTRDELTRDEEGMRLGGLGVSVTIINSFNTILGSILPSSFVCFFCIVSTSLSWISVLRPQYFAH